MSIQLYTVEAESFLNTAGRTTAVDVNLNICLVLAEDAAFMRYFFKV